MLHQQLPPPVFTTPPLLHDTSARFNAAAFYTDLVDRYQLTHSLQAALDYIEQGAGWDTRLDCQSAAPIPWEFDFCETPLLLTRLYTYYPEVASESQVDIFLYLHVYRDKMSTWASAHPTSTRGWLHQVVDPLTEPAAFNSLSDSHGSSNRRSGNGSPYNPPRYAPTPPFSPSHDVGHGLNSTPPRHDYPPSGSTSLYSHNRLTNPRRRPE